MSGVMQIVEPLAERFLNPEPGVGGVIKQRPEDFLVEEIPLYDPAGEGEHLYLGIEKKLVSHTELLSCLRRHFDVDDRAIGFAGMKDKVAITQQAVSVHVLKDPPSLELPHERIRVLWAQRHRNKLRRGHLRGNRFSIRIREVDPLRVARVRDALRLLEKTGVPNYFGSQRFGYRRNNHLLGAFLLHGKWTEFLAELLGAGGSAFPEHQEERRALFDRQAYREALASWAAPDRAERRALRALARGGSDKHACLALGKVSLSFLVNAWQSAIFNRVLDHRIDDGRIGSIAPGDVASRHEGRRDFNVADAQLARELEEDVARLAVSPTGPLWGEGMRRADGAVDEVEREALAATGLELDPYLASPFCAVGSRRPFRSPLGSSEFESGVDEHGGFIRVAFDLPRGGYATIAVRELMKNEP